jgi:hypothetical protein
MAGRCADGQPSAIYTFPAEPAAALLGVLRIAAELGPLSQGTGTGRRLGPWAAIERPAAQQRRQAEHADNRKHEP